MGIIDSATLMRELGIAERCEDCPRYDGRCKGHLTWMCKGIRNTTQTRYQLSEDAEEKALAELVVNREKRRVIQKMTRDELQRYLVHIYRGGFEDGLSAVQDAMKKESEQTEEVSVDWEDVLSVIAQVKGVGDKTLRAIDQKLREAY